jgi:DNA ligase (NAD+)
MNSKKLLEFLIGLEQVRAREVEGHGEVFLRVDDFTELNAALVEADKVPFAHRATPPPARCARRTPRSPPAASCGCCHGLGKREGLDAGSRQMPLTKIV